MLRYDNTLISSFILVTFQILTKFLVILLGETTCTDIDDGYLDSKRVKIPI